MINISDRPVLLAGGIDLHRATQRAIKVAVEILETQFSKRASLENISQFGFYRFLGTHNHRLDTRFDEDFIQACFDVSQADSRNAGNRNVRNKLAEFLIEENLPAHGLSSLKRGLKVMLVELWRVRILLLPSTFTTGPHFAIDLYEHELLSWLKSFDPAQQAEGAGSADARRLYYYGQRLLWTTDWQKPGDIRLEDLGSLNRALILYQNQLSPVVIAGGTQLPFTLLASQALQHFRDQVQYSTEDLERYSLWLLSGSAHAQSFEEYSIAPAPKIGPVPSKTPRANAPRPPPDLLDPLAGSDVHQALRVNFASLQKGHRLSADWSVHDRLVYLGREHVQLKDVTPYWLQAMRAYIHNRKYVKEYRSDGEAMAVLNLLADYLFFYLPWWRELAKSPRVEIPRSPRELTRFAFVARHSAESIDQFPETLLTVIRWRRKSNESVAIAVQQLYAFFKFLETHFCEEESIAGPEFRIPLNPDFDAPRIPSRGKTTKEIIPKNIYSYLLFYCYAVEKAGLELERLAVSGELLDDRKKLLKNQWLRPDDFGFSINVAYRSTQLPLLEIPNVFQWAERELKSAGDEASKSVYIPHCTALRLLLTSVETGLRGQSVQWLDRRTWRRKGSQVSADSYTFPLYVNTDKTKIHPWVTPVVYRVRDLLHRQETFQSQFADADKFAAVTYEQNEIAPFDLIEPLFRAVGRGSPITDNLYQKTWQRLMVGFEAFFREVTGESHVRLYKLQAILGEDEQPVVRPVKDGRSPLYCPMSLLAIHTPHACRATFVTNRKGILDLSDAGQLLGHSGVVVTAHYDKPSIEDLQARLKASDLAQSRDFLQFDAESDVHVRADKPDSALVRSFTRDRDATLKAFRFVPGVSLWSMEDVAKDEGLELLREGPMSRIRFRETHICPVGEECPADILERIGAPRRCGCCPLATRCVDHLPAIAAKRNQLLERIRYLHGRYKTLEGQGEPVSVLDEIWDELELDANEYLGLQVSEEVLSSTAAASGIDDGLPALHVEQPDVVKRHLTRVSRSCNTAELMLQRIADSNAYPGMATPQIQMAAAQVKRRLLAGRGTDSIEWGDEGASAVKDVALMLGVMMKANGLSREQTARALSSSTTANMSRLITGGTDGQ